jgi:hypothetical protein
MKTVRKRSESAAAGAMGLRDALRATGLGEDRYATEFSGMLDRLRDAKVEAGAGKLWLDAMKEWARHLHAPVELREVVADGEDGGPVVELVHHVARPTREARRKEESQQIGFQFVKEG